MVPSRAAYRICAPSAWPSATQSLHLQVSSTGLDGREIRFGLVREAQELLASRKVTGAVTSGCSRKAGRENAPEKS